MKRRPLLLATLVGALVFVAAFSFAVREAARARTTADTAEDLRRESIRRQASAARSAAVPSSSAGSLAAPKISAPATPPATSPPTPPDELEALHQRALETSAQLSLARFIRLRALPTDQATALTRLVAHHQLTRERLNADPAAAKGPSDPGAPAYRARWETARAEEHADLAALLGPDGVQAYDDYQRTQPLWTQVRALATQLYDTPTPLTPVQAESLMRLLVAGATTPNGEIRGTVADWDLVFARTESLLAPPQRAALKAAHDSSELVIELNRAHVRARAAKK